MRRVCLKSKLGSWIGLARASVSGLRWDWHSTLRGGRCVGNAVANVVGAGAHGVALLEDADAKPYRLCRPPSRCEQPLTPLLAAMLPRFPADEAHGSAACAAFVSAGASRSCWCMKPFAGR